VPPVFDIFIRIDLVVSARQMAATEWLQTTREALNWVGKRALPGNNSRCLGSDGPTKTLTELGVTWRNPAPVARANEAEAAH
jgi:hypothetical protein